MTTILIFLLAGLWYFSHRVANQLTVRRTRHA
jgi:hypothetical protein